MTEIEEIKEQLERMEKQAQDNFNMLHSLMLAIQAGGVDLK